MGSSVRQSRIGDISAMNSLFRSKYPPRRGSFQSNPFEDELILAWPVEAHRSHIPKLWRRLDHAPCNVTRQTVNELCNPVARFDHGSVIHNHRQRAGNLPGNRHRKIVPASGNQRDFDSRAAAFTIACRLMSGSWERPSRSVPSMSGNEPYRHSSSLPCYCAWGHKLIEVICPVWQLFQCSTGAMAKSKDNHSGRSPYVHLAVCNRRRDEFVV